MANVFLACEACIEDHPYARRDYERLTAYAAIDRNRRHNLVDLPEEADILVFVGSSRPNFSDVTGSALFQRFPERSLILYSGDRGIPLLPGLYTCLERRSMGHRPAALAGFYLRVTENRSLDIAEGIDQAEYLYSFVGNARNHPVRLAICRLRDTRAYLRDSSGDDRQQDDGVGGANRDRGLHYREVMARSKFVLCPRGIGVSSWRLFETLRAGRVPVVLSDDWVRPPGPDWNACCLFVPEARVGDLPRLLADAEPRAVAMGAAARREWERWYAEENVFHTAIEQLLVAHQRRAEEGWRAWLATYALYLEPFYLRYWVLSPLKRRLLALAGRALTRHAATPK